MEYIVRYYKDGQWKNSTGSYTSKQAVNERVEFLQNKGYEVEVVQVRK